MTTGITYFYSTYSAYAYIGHELFEQIAERADRSIIHRPFHINRCLENIGAQAWEDRTQANLDYHFQRQRDRWSEYRSVAMPKVTPTSHSNEALIGDKAIIAAETLGLDLNSMCYLLMSQHWQHDLDLSNLEQVRTCLNQNGYDTNPLFDLMLRPETQAAYNANTEEAIRLSVFGSPTYIVDGDIFYGQDNLVLVERALERPFG